MARRRFKLMLDDHRNKKFVSAQERIFKKHYLMSHQGADNSPISPYFKKYLQKTEDVSQPQPQLILINLILEIT